MWPPSDMDRPGGWGAKKFPPGLLFAAGTGGAELPTIHSAEMPIPNLRGRRLRTAISTRTIE